MKVIESTDFYLRVVKFDFRHPDPEVNLSFRIVPVFHIGSEKFYRNIFKYLKECDEVLYEDLQFKRLILITSHYQKVAKRLNLISQDVLNLRELDVKLTHADLTKKEAKEAWRNTSIIEKIKFLIIEPLIFRIQTRNLTRRKLAKHFSTANQELLLAYGPRFDKPRSSENFIWNEREKKVFEVIKHSFSIEKNIQKRIGIIYGAGHMKRIARFLIDKLDCVPTNAEFIEVYPLWEE
ncbi:MAG: hypothetical protein AAFO07_26815 [Bacteroidota bacterium]